MEHSQDDVAQKDQPTFQEEPPSLPPSLPPSPPPKDSLGPVIRQILRVS